ncbi:MAG: 3-dehydroquinate synthase [Desulfobacteraceae bacterium]|nr:3-dehydroquinate synthase [Desulfobacteraceae bacterium]
MMNISYHLMVSAKTLTYPIYIGESLHDLFKDYFDKYPKIALITNDTIFDLYRKFISNIEVRFPQVFHIAIKDGEKYKNIATLNEVYQKLISEDLGRDGLIIAFGGGVIGDLAGVASATYMRGIDFIQAPTTLLAMVDSSIGGKTAINLSKGKNIVGAFHQPKAVLCDLIFLDTLPIRQFNSGLMEVIKYGLILDSSLYNYFIKNKENVKNHDKDTIAYLIYRCCQLKAKIVAEDEKEKGIRSILNFGHTVGHALESYTNYKFYLHGEAVAIGSLAIISYLVERGILNKNVLREFDDILSFFQLPTSIPADFDIEQIIRHLSYDKKKRYGINQWVTLKQIGVPAWEQLIDLKEVENILRGLKENG